MRQQYGNHRSACKNRAAKAKDGAAPGGLFLDTGAVKNPATPAALLLAALCLCCPPMVRADQPAPAVSFTAHIRPLLTSRCISCHHSGSMLGQLSLENRAMAFHKRMNGPVILPGRPDSSPLYLVLKMPPKAPKAMPPAGHRVTDREINLIYDWIKQGAPWPQGREGVVIPPRRDRRIGT